jgi:hypothetical protein
MSKVLSPGSGGSKPATALNFQSITDLNPDLALRAHWAWSGCIITSKNATGKIERHRS